VAITTYTELQTALANWTHRADLGARHPEFIALVEAKLNRLLHDRRKQTTASIAMTSGAGPLPADFLAMRRVTWDGDSDANLTYVPPEYFAIAYPAGESGTPDVYTIEGPTLKVRPVSSTSLNVLYDQKVPALETNATNWVLASHPDVYLSGALAEAYAYIGDLDKAVVWNEKADRHIAELLAAEAAQRGPLQIKPVGVAIV
jgi:hypothetical protein